MFLLQVAIVYQLDICGESSVAMFTEGVVGVHGFGM